ncbi:hypothetical protein IMY05_006G0202100 [Salix suchowensis]|nr:hypothetical protein IMY05_006G0202100 [Salix suchowensis]
MFPHFLITVMLLQAHRIQSRCTRKTHWRVELDRLSGSPYNMHCVLAPVMRGQCWSGCKFRLLKKWRSYYLIL